MVKKSQGRGYRILKRLGVEELILALCGGFFYYPLTIPCNIPLYKERGLIRGYIKDIRLR